MRSCSNVAYLLGDISEAAKYLLAVWFETTSLKLFYDTQLCCSVSFAACEALPNFRGLRGFCPDSKKSKLSL